MCFHICCPFRFLVYLKLSIVMGLNWLLEVVSSVTPDLLKDVWYISDTYNMLVGLAIFLIFVCKKKIFKKLYMRCVCVDLSLLYLGIHGYTTNCE